MSSRKKIIIYLGVVDKQIFIEASWLTAEITASQDRIPQCGVTNTNTEIPAVDL
jgi:hypothetical protein